ncbi:fimbrial protein [Pseudomonas sp. 2(2015)]|uniref:fimbrial protein n=1 Tax=Pseudomonas sp. 2(2015) TaxID=1619950 RepID=UPI00061FC267|nr:fimbrial protein [Pseudomonas sp. 2(2015)]KJK14899.1 hypothetical protein UB48_24225 [Pseudomonas sp. 2(2015)]
MTIVRSTLLAILLGCAFTTHADEQQVVTIEGFVYAAIPCVINRDKPITGPFGDVQTAGIDGKYKTISLNYDLDCSRSATNELRMQVRGDPAFDPALLVVRGYDNLGIALKKDGAPLALNTWAEFDSRKKPKLQAVLVKRGNSVVQAGSFNAGATLVVDYR